MRNVTTCKQSNILSDTTFIILSTRIPYRGKSYGSKSFSLHNDIPIINYQINIIKECFPKSQIMIVTGFESERFYNLENVRLVENQLYETYGDGESLKLALINNTTENIVLLNNDVIINKGYLHNIQEYGSSLVVTKGCEKQKIGCTITEGNINYINYGIDEYEFTGIIYLEKKDVESLKKMTFIKSKKNLFTFELINEIIDRGSKIRGIIK